MVGVKIHRVNPDGTHTVTYGDDDVGTVESDGSYNPISRMPDRPLPVGMPEALKEIFRTVRELFEKLNTDPVSTSGGIRNGITGDLDQLYPSPFAVPKAISPKVKSTFETCSRYPQRTDPFTLDLDGDGLETKGINTANPLLFDINATGIKQSIGWVKPDDGFLALDRNGNGIIDSGAELFGNVTPLSIGRNALDGFEALADQDTNHDGVVNSLDANFANMRIWQDLNQDGISQSTELFTLAQKNIASIHVAKTEHLTVLDNGNALADLGTFTRTDGSEGTTGSVGQLGDIDLAVDTFHSQFTDTIASTAETINLPDMGGSGQVRSLRQAASLDTAAGHTLAGLLTQYNLGNRADQQAQIDGLIKAWADTSTMATTFTGAYAGHALSIDMQGWYYGASFNPGGVDYQAIADKLTVLERFNGRTYQAVPEGADAVNLTLWHDPRDLLQISYDTLKESVYSTLMMQTRLKPYLDAIELVIDEAGIRFDFAAVNAAFMAKANADVPNAIYDLLDMQKYEGTQMRGLGWTVYSTLEAVVRAAPASPALQAVLNAEHIELVADGVLVAAANNQVGATVLGNALNNTISGGAGNDYLYGGAGNDTISGGAGDNILDGGDGNDTLFGNAGHNTLLGGAGDDYMYVQYNNSSNNVFEGGAGNDTLGGSLYNDTYRFNLGDGQDAIYENIPIGATYTDTLVFGAGIAASDIKALRSGNDMVFSHINGTDRVTVVGWFTDVGYQLELVMFADGTTWNGPALTAAALIVMGTNGDDVMTGTVMNDTLRGGAGNDTISGGAGDNILDGGDGNDTLFGNAGRNTLLGGAGDDYMYVQYNGSSDNVFEGGTGNDILGGSIYNDTYRFNLGDGQDKIYENPPQNANAIDALVFGAGIAASDIKARRTGDDMVFRHISGTDRVTVVGWFTDAGYQLEQVTFTDGTVWNAAALTAAALSPTGTPDDDVLTSYAWGTHLTGGAGNDVLTSVHNAEIWNNTYDGGAGDDTLIGSFAKDTYLFSRGDGHDTITDDVRFYPNAAAPNEFASDVNNPNYKDNLVFGAGITQYEVAVSRTGIDMVLTLTGGADTITVKNWFDGSIFTKLEQVTFADGTTWSTTRLEQILAGGGTVAPPNRAPVAAALADQQAIETQLFTYTLPAGAFTDADVGDTLHLAATLANGAALPAWLGFDAATQTFSGTPPNTASGTLAFKVTATDAAGATASSNFNVEIFNAISGTANNETLTGTAARDYLYGFAGNDTLNGGLGADAMIGGLGNDTYVVDNTGDVVVELAGEGTDTVQSLVTYTLADNVENLTLTGIAAINGTGNALGNVLTGNAASNVLTGSDGNDTLNGGAGADTLVGGAGNDKYIIDNVGDVVLELAGGGTDTVQSSISYTLTDNVENLTLTGIAAINGTGNALGNVLTGNVASNTLTGGDANDTLNGGGGADTLIGGAGNDKYVVDDAGDMVVELAGGGIDIVQSAISYTLTDDVENLTLTGNAAINGTGNALGNVLTGNVSSNTLTGGNGNDTLNGGGGADTLIGSGGDDTYTVDNAADVVIELATEGIDKISASVSYLLADNVENLTLTGSTAIDGTGNALDNVLLGNSAANTLAGGAGNDSLNGAAGNDTLDGGAGTDTLTGGIGNDTYLLGQGYGADTVKENDSIAGNHDTLQFTGGIATDQIWLRKVSNNLEVSVIGTADKMTISNWYLGSQYHVEEFTTSDGKMLLDSQVQNLVQAMAAFAPPAAGQTTLTAAQQATLAPVLAANWH